MNICGREYDYFQPNMNICGSVSVHICGSVCMVANTTHRRNSGKRAALQELIYRPVMAITVCRVLIMGLLSTFPRVGIIPEKNGLQNTLLKRRKQFLLRSTCISCNVQGQTGQKSANVNKALLADFYANNLRILYYRYGGASTILSNFPTSDLNFQCFHFEFRLEIFYNYYSDFFPF